MSEPFASGVTLLQYATMLAGREDELPEPEILRLAGIDARTWRHAEPAWSQRILDDLGAGGTLGDELARAMDEARARWSRPLPPLDEDLRAYLDFDRHFAEEPDGEAFLAARGMRSADTARLDALWRGRLAADAALRQKAVAILGEPPGRIVEPSPGPASIRRGEP